MISTMIVAGLAGTRLARAWLHEEVGEPFRQPVEAWAAPNFEMIGEPGSADMIVTDSATMLTVKNYVDVLITCPHCIGFWFTLGSVIGLRWKPTRPIVTALAGAMILSAFADHYPGFDPTTDADD